MSGIATSVANNNAGVQVNSLANDFSKQSVVELILTADNDAGTAALPSVNILPGCGKGAVTTLPVGVTVSGDYTTWANWIDYVQRVDMKIESIWMQSADTANFDQRLTFGLIMPNGTTPNETFRQLQDYKVSTGNGFADNITINNTPMVVLPQFYAKLTVKKNTALRIQLHITEANVSATTTPISY